MKEIFKSKIMLLFIVFVLGVTYINSMQLSNFENSDEVAISTSEDYKIKKSI